MTRQLASVPGWFRPLPSGHLHWVTEWLGRDNGRTACRPIRYGYATSWGWTDNFPPGTRRCATCQVVHGAGAMTHDDGYLDLTGFTRPGGDEDGPRAGSVIAAVVLIIFVALTAWLGWALLTLVGR